MKPEAEIDACGYGTPTGPCPTQSPPDGFCETHRDPRFTVCWGCAGDAVRLCEYDGPHSAPLCGDCVHLGAPGSGDHGPLTRQETPLAPGEPETGATPPSVEGVRQDLVETAVLSMRAARAQEPALTDYQVAEKLIEDLGTSVLLGMMHGLGRARAAQNGGTG